MFTVCFWKDAWERAIGAAASTAVSLTTLNTAFQALDWKQISSIAATSGVVSILTSISALGFGKENSASFLGKVTGEQQYGRHSK